MTEFDSLGAFARHLQRVAGLGEEVTGHLTLEVAKVVQADAKARIGEYQDGIGGFPAWANLAPSTVDDRLRKGFTPDDPLLRTGELRDSIEIAHQGHEATVGSADQVLYWQETGTEHIPPRPVLGPAGYVSKSKIEEVLSIGVMAWIAGLSWRRPPLTRPGEAGPARR